MNYTNTDTLIYFWTSSRWIIYFSRSSRGIISSRKHIILNFLLKFCCCICTVATKDSIFIMIYEMYLLFTVQRLHFTGATSLPASKYIQTVSNQIFGASGLTTFTFDNPCLIFFYFFFMLNLTYKHRAIVGLFYCILSPTSNLWQILCNIFCTTNKARFSDLMQNLKNFPMTIRFVFNCNLYTNQKRFFNVKFSWKVIAIQEWLCYVAHCLWSATTVKEEDVRSHTILKHNLQSTFKT